MEILGRKSSIILCYTNLEDDSVLEEIFVSVLQYLFESSTSIPFAEYQNTERASPLARDELRRFGQKWWQKDFHLYTLLGNVEI